MRDRSIERTSLMPSREHLQFIMSLVVLGVRVQYYMTARGMGWLLCCKFIWTATKIRQENFQLPLLLSEAGSFISLIYRLFAKYRMIPKEGKVGYSGCGQTQCHSVSDYYEHISNIQNTSHFQWK